MTPPVPDHHSAPGPVDDPGGSAAGGSAAGGSGTSATSTSAAGGFGPSTYGDAFADVYDRWYGDLPGLDETIAAVERLAGDGPVLELACGTGRLLLPAAARGLTVHGLDASAAMLGQLRAKGEELDAVTAAGGRVETHLADMARFDLGPMRFSLVFLAFNSLFNLTTAEDQAACFAAVAHHLEPGGRFALECAVPADRVDGPTDAVDLHSLTADRVTLRVWRQDRAAQTVMGQHVDITEAGIRLRPWLLRYSTVGQLDAMATAAGLELEHRWADWSGGTFDAEGGGHVSVYRRPVATIA
jgi:SAM-dependent methyltransferase